MKRVLSSPFALDTRSLALLRIGLGLLLLVDLGIRATALTAHYSDAGVLPRDAWIAHGQTPWAWSLHLMTGEPLGQALLFLLAAVAAASLLVGYRTRTATFVSWLLLLSLHMHNPLVLNSGDTLLRMLLLWAMFLPTARRWSLDARRTAAPEQPAGRGDRVHSIASAALVLQLVCVYAVAGITKFGDAWRRGDALIAALDQDLYLKPLGAWLLDQPDLLRAVGWTVPWLEAGAAVLLLLPLFVPWVRCALIVAMLAFHLGIELTLQVGLFSWVAAVAWTALVPSAVWELARRRSAAEGREAAAPSKPAPGWAPSIVAGVLLVYVVAYNADQLWRREAGRVLLPTGWTEAGVALGLDQRWMLFTNPGEIDGWYLIVIEHADGTKTELLTGQPFDPLTFGKPTDISGAYPNHRWRKYFNVIAKDGYEWVRPYMAGPLCRWADERWPDNPAAYIEVNYIEEGPATARRLVFYRGVCPKESDVHFEPIDAGGI